MAHKYKNPRLSPYWQRKEGEIMTRDNFTCQECGDDTTELVVFDLDDNEDPYDTPHKFLVTLCVNCEKNIKDALEKSRQK